jgi:Domain of unknown function (DUF3303)
MTKYLLKWKLNPLTTPEDPEKRVKLWVSMLEMVKASLKSGEFIDWGAYVDINGGYCIGEGTEVEAFASMLKWTPYVIFDAKPVLSVDQAIGEINKAIAGSKPK